MTMAALFWLNGWLVRILSVLAVLIVAAMMLGISAEVILRTLSFPSIPGMIELTEYGLFISTFFVAPHLLRTNEHIRVDIMMSRVDPAAARYVECGVLVTIIAISTITGFVGTSVMLMSARDGTMVFKDLVFPQWWLDWVIPLTSLAIALQALEMLIALRRGAAFAREEASGHVPGLRPEEMP
jgi:TRAP-type C4-dicarboxylate transport system permease small subunit